MKKPIDIYDGLFWTDTPQEIRRLKLNQTSNNAFPDTGWRPPTDWPMVRDSPWISIDCETFDPDLNEAGPGWARGVGHVVGVSLACPAGVWYFPFRHTVQTDYNMDTANVLAYLSWVLGGDCPKIGANITYDIGWLKHEGVTVNGKFYDVQFAEALINEVSKVSLEELGYQYLKRGKATDILEDWVIEAYKPPKTKWRREIYRSPPSLVGTYAEQDAAMPYEILEKQWPILKHMGLLDLFEMECDLINLFVEMRFAGITVDVPYTEQLLEEFKAKSATLTAEAVRQSGVKGLNVNASASLAQAFDNLGLEYGYTAPTDAYPNGQPSFTADFLKGLTDPFGKLINDIKNLDKICSTFLQGYILDKNVNSKVYCSFNQMSGEGGGARTGRLSSSSPNLQNIPIRTAEGKLIRACFIPDVGHTQLVDYDFSQIEYRMLAHFATGPGSDDVRAQFCNDPNTDYHKLVGKLILDVTNIDLARSYIKTVNFGSIYGTGVAHMAEMLGLELSKAKELLTTYHKSLPYVKHTMDSVARETNLSGVVRTILGRTSHFDEWEAIEFNDRDIPLPLDQALEKWGSHNIMRSGLYKAVNYKLQGSAADIMKKGMRDCYKSGIFHETGVPRLTVHDELLFSDPGNVRPEAWKEMQHIFETCVPCKIPIVFEAGAGPNWMDAH